MGGWESRWWSRSTRDSLPPTNTLKIHLHVRQFSQKKIGNWWKIYTTQATRNISQPGRTEKYFKGIRTSPTPWERYVTERNLKGNLQGKCREKEIKPGSQARKGKFIRGKREGDRLLRRTSILPFWWSPSYTPPMNNSLKGWSRSQRSWLWWPHSFEKIGTSEKKGYHLGNLVSLKNHCDCILCEVDMMSHLISKTPCSPYHSSLFWFRIMVNLL